MYQAVLAPLVHSALGSANMGSCKNGFVGKVSSVVQL